MIATLSELVAQGLPVDSLVAAVLWRGEKDKERLARELRALRAVGVEIEWHATGTSSRPSTAARSSAALTAG